MLAAALSSELLLGATSVAVSRLHPSAADPDHPSRTATDAQTQTELVDQARQIVAIAALQNPTAGYRLLSCKDRDNPPYQGAVYMTFALPADPGADDYFRNMATAMAARGWTERLLPNRAIVGRAFSKDGFTANLYQDGDVEKHGVARIYGQCNNMNNHRADPTAWTDITAQLH